LINYSGSDGISHDPVTVKWLNDSNMMKPDHFNYQAYLLRLRRVENAGQPVWRFSLEQPGCGDRRQFDRLVDVFEFLQQQMQRDEVAIDETVNDEQ
jgi:hypothetical protein